MDDEQPGTELWGEGWGGGEVGRVPRQSPGDVVPKALSLSDLLALRDRLRSVCKSHDFSYDDMRIVIPRIKLDGVELEFGDVASPVIRSTKAMMNAEQARQAIYAGEPVECTAEDYKINVRSAIEDYRNRADDIGNRELFDRCKGELERLDKQFAD